VAIRLNRVSWRSEAIVQRSNSAYHFQEGWMHGKPTDAE